MSDDPDLSRRTFLKATGAGTATAMVAGCIGGDDEGNGNDTEDDDGMGDGDGNGMDDDGNGEGNGGSGGGTLNLAGGTLTTLDPIAADDTASSSIINNVYETLTHFQDGSTELVNQLAADYELSEDLTTITFDLVDAQYHDGRDLTAQDFVYSWRRLAESTNSVRRNFVIEPTFLTVEHETETVEQDGEEVEQVVPESLGVEAVDDSTFEVTLEQPSANALEIISYASFAAIPEGIVGDIEGYDGEIPQEELASDTMIGTGPYEFDHWEPDAEWQITRNDDYHGEPASIETVHLQIIEDSEALYTYGQEGSSDLIAIPTSHYDQSLISIEEETDAGHEVGTYGPMENGETANYVALPEMSTFYFAFNAEYVPRPVRQAIFHILDHEQLIQDIFSGRGVEAYTFTPPSIWPGGQENYDSFVSDYPYGQGESDRDSAEQVLSDAGYTSGDPFELTLTTYESDVFQEAGRLLRDQVSGLGIELNLEQSPFATLQQRGVSGDLEMYSLGWIWSWPEANYGHFGFEPENTETGQAMQSGETNGYYLNWHTEDSEASQQAQEAWDQIESNPHPEEGQEARNEGYRQMEQAIWDDAILLPLYHNLVEYFFYDRVNYESYPGALGSHRQQYTRLSLDE